MGSPPLPALRSPQIHLSYSPKDSDLVRHFRLPPFSTQASVQSLYSKSWGLVIGINNYGGQFPLLGNAVNDARAVGDMLEHVYGFDEVHRLFDAEANQAAIRQWLFDTARQAIGSNDRLIFFFAGHGTSLKSSGHPYGYLIPQDAKDGAYYTYLDMEELRRACGLISAKHILLILDCCFSGIAAVTARSTRSASPRIVDDAYIQSITKRRAWQVLTAGTSDELAADSGSRPGHSAFTIALLDALQEGRADHNQDGIITASDVATYIKPEVSRATTRFGSTGQTPFFNYMAGSEQGDFVFVLPDYPVNQEAAAPSFEPAASKRSPRWLLRVAGVILAAAAIVGILYLDDYLSRAIIPVATPTALTFATLSAAEPSVIMEPIRIGVVYQDSSGAARYIGDDQRIGVEIAVEYFNEKGGVKGREIELVPWGTDGTDAKTQDAFRNAINSNIVAIVGPTTSKEAASADPIAEDAGVPVIASTNTAENIPSLGTYISRVSAGVDQVVPHAVAVAFDRNPNIRKVAIVYPDDDDPFVESEVRAFQNAVIARLSRTAALNDTPVITQTFQMSDDDLATEMSEFLNEQPDLVLVSGQTLDAIELVKHLREGGYEGLIVGGDGLSTPEVLNRCAAQCVGLLIAQPYNWESDTDLNTWFVAKYRERKNTDKYPPQYVAQNFTAIQVIVEALIALDSGQPINELELPVLRTALNDKLLSVMTFSTLLGMIDFDSEGEIRQGDFAVAEIQESDGNLKFRIVDE
jgi:branched-chain amino acid transport system substrate-binding protein